MTSTASPTVTPDLAALVAGLAAYRGSVAARTTQAATAKVRADLDRRAREEDRILQGLVRAGGLDAVRITDAAWTAGRDAALREGEHEADATGADTTAEVLHETRAGLGVLDEEDLPVRGFDSLTVPEATKAIERLTDQHDLRVVDAYERAHKNRKTVLDAVLKHSATLVDDTGR